MRDFTYTVYRKLLETYQQQGYSLISYLQYLTEPKPKKFVVLRHDVDKKPANSLETAKIESELGAKGSYYFRNVPQSFQPEYIKSIVDLGHEIGYHYEELSQTNGDFEKAIYEFKNNLGHLRKYYPVKTMCMHGSPLSKWDNKKLWQKNNYRDYGIIAEPYFDENFTKMLYITDTGRTWANTRANVRDKVNSGFNIHLSTTNDIITTLLKGQLPSAIMQNIHPQRWNDNFLLWTEELISQNLKNIVKAAISK